MVLCPTDTVHISLANSMTLDEALSRDMFTNERFEAAQEYLRAVNAGLTPEERRDLHGIAHRTLKMSCFEGDTSWCKEYVKKYTQAIRDNSESTESCCLHHEAHTVITITFLILEKELME